MSAKEMFEELGYEYDIKKTRITAKLYDRDDVLSINISFHTINKRISIDCLGDALDMDELQAINKQVEELGWKNENNRFIN